jgi:hypothetical protein
VPTPSAHRPDVLSVAGRVRAAASRTARLTSAGHRIGLAGKRAHYILVVKKNQPGLYAQVKNLPWRHVPVASRQHNRGHGRPAQPGHRHLENGRARQHRRRLQAPRPGRHPDPRNPRTAPSMSKTDTTRLRRGPGGCCTPLPYRHRLALADGEVADVACARSGDPRGDQGLEGRGPQPIGAAGEVPLLEVCTCGMVHDR